ncbi:MAG: hypothetical protein C4576_00700 [Desulfobacteraceae bacterium]|nr:MAG: hypothetical protein C4576_00700 [Desulfobacteraceae bacterium]
MKSCAEYKEILFMDVYGELDSITRSRWEAHLSECATCRQEYTRMLRLAGKVKEVMTPPPLTEADSRSIIRAVRTEMIQGEERRSKPGWLSRSWRLSPALATACVFAAIISIWSLGSFDSHLKKDKSVGKEHSQGVRVEDLEIIKNLDLLKQMDSVEKLVHALDEPEDDPSTPGSDPRPQGMTSHEKRVRYS